MFYLRIAQNKQVQHFCRAKNKTRITRVLDASRNEGRYKCDVAECLGQRICVRSMSMQEIAMYKAECTLQNVDCYKTRKCLWPNVMAKLKWICTEVNRQWRTVSAVDNVWGRVHFVERLFDVYFAEPLISESSDKDLKDAIYLYVFKQLENYDVKRFRNDLIEIQSAYSDSRNAKKCDSTGSGTECVGDLMRKYHDRKGVDDEMDSKMNQKHVAFRQFMEGLDEREMQIINLSVKMHYALHHGTAVAATNHKKRRAEQLSDQGPPEKKAKHSSQTNYHQRAAMIHRTGDHKLDVSSESEADDESQ